MPEIARFYGIIVEMRWREHGVAHVHVRYAGYVASIGITPFALLRGQLPTRAFRLVEEWVELHRKELEEDWQLAVQHQPIKPIPPLS
jgi:hypothetical protein